MNRSHSDSDKKLSQLLRMLSYSKGSGWIPSDEFDSVRAHRFALTQARDSMKIVGAFCWLGGQEDTLIAAPLVYVAIAKDRSEAQLIHKKVWSQGLAPFLLLITSVEVIMCQGFTYDRENWDHSSQFFNWKDLLSQPEDISPLVNLNAIRLRSSLFWRDHAINVSGRVDQCLLDGLDGLSWSLKNGAHVSTKLPYTAANGLIGKLLYVFFLHDRGILSREWLVDRGHLEIDLANPNSALTKKSLWKLLDDLDSIFNGSIFPLSRSDRSNIDDSHINLVRAIMKHGAVVTTYGAMQLSFLDIDLGVLRVETLSAVYEQFLENVKEGERRKVGAYYTPPFLVDLILDRVEDACPLRDGTKVLDPAAGSGVFLVGAYRRILEHTRNFASEELSLDRVRELLISNIFGVERNSDACNVAAFSLYLTMLDYINPRDLTRVADGNDPKKLFPSLIGKNLFARDFFTKFSLVQLPKIDCVVGNPPWQSVAKLESQPATQWLNGNPNSPVGDDQAAELFVWKSLREHMANDGVLAMLIPAKSFVNPTSAKFRKQLSEEFSLIGAINFAHMRHRLFVGAKHACAGIFVRNSRATSSALTWVYSPLSICQPIASRKELPWTLIMDKAEVQLFRHDFFKENARSWFEAFVLRPVDRQIQRYIIDSASVKKISLLGSLCESVGALIKRGGSTSETGLEKRYLVEDTSHSDNRHGDNLDLFPESNLTLPAKRNEIPLSEIAKIKSTYKNQFSGNILLVPRNFNDIRLVEYRKGYSSSFLAVFFNKSGSNVTEPEKRFLRGLAKYLNSKTALYFMATIGRRWLMDRRNVEPADFSAMPIPLSSITDERLDGLLNNDGEELEKFIQKAFGLDGDLRSAIREFLQFRMHFQDGNVPDRALTIPTQAMLAGYSKVMHRCLDGLIGRKDAFRVAHCAAPDAGIGVIVAQFLDEDATEKHDTDLELICEKAIASYQSLSTNSFSNSLGLLADSKFGTVAVTKPLEYFRWTIDSAYTDSRNVMDAFVSGGN